MVEVFFSILTKQGVVHSVHGSKRELKEFLLDFIACNNQDPKRFICDQGPGESCSASLKRRNNA